MMTLGLVASSVANGGITEPYSATTGAGSSTVTSFTVTSPGTVETNDIILVTVSVRQDRTITTPSGWTAVSHSQGTGLSGLNLYVFWCRGNPSTLDFAISASSSGWAWSARVFRGVRTSGAPWDSTATGGSTDTSVEVPTLTSLAANCTAVACAGFADTSAPLPTTFGSSPAGWSAVSQALNSASQYGIMTATDPLGSATSVAEAVWTLDQTPQSWASRMIALVSA